MGPYGEFEIYSHPISAAANGTDVIHAALTGQPTGHNIIELFYLVCGTSAAGSMVVETKPAGAAVALTGVIPVAALDRLVIGRIPTEDERTVPCLRTADAGGLQITGAGGADLKGFAIYGIRVGP